MQLFMSQIRLAFASTDDHEMGDVHVHLCMLCHTGCTVSNPPAPLHSWSQLLGSLTLGLHHHAWSNNGAYMPHGQLSGPAPKQCCHRIALGSSDCMVNYGTIQGRFLMHLDSYSYIQPLLSPLPSLPHSKLLCAHSAGDSSTFIRCRAASHRGLAKYDTRVKGLRRSTCAQGVSVFAHHCLSPLLCKIAMMRSCKTMGCILVPLGL